MTVMNCYVKSRLGMRGYRFRVYGAWKEKERFNISKQRLANQARNEKEHQQFMEEELKW